LQIRNIDGLDPVKAAINTTPLAAVDGTAFTGSNVNTSRNIVITIRPNPDWDDWTYETLRRLMYLYFVPKQAINLVFASDDLPSVKIAGYTEDVTLNPYTKDPEYQASIICPDPYFTSVEPTVIEGKTNSTVDIPYEGTVESGIELKITKDPINADASSVIINVETYPVGFPLLGVILPVYCTLTDNDYYIMSSIPGHKYVQNISLSTGVITNLTGNMLPNPQQGWPMIQPGTNKFSVSTEANAQDFELTYFERFGGL
jgi:hypothetical protein